MIRFSLLCLVAVVAPGSVAPAEAQAPPADTLHATLDLRQSIADGWLDPETEVVGLRGGISPLSWQVTTPAEDPDGDGVYALAVPFRVLGDSLRVELKIKIDGPGNPNDGWQDGPNHTVVVRPGGAQLALAFEDRSEPPATVLTGRIDVIEGVEAEGLRPRDVYVWLPPDYDADSSRRYPVLYLHDGGSKFGHGGADWGMDEAAHALIESGQIEPLILVAVANTSDRTDEYTPTRQIWERTLRRVGPPTSDHPTLGPGTGTFDSDGDTVRVDVLDGQLAVTVPGTSQPAELVPQDDGRYVLPQAGITFEAIRQRDGSIDTVLATKPPGGGLGDAYGRLLTDTVKPMIDDRYRTRPGAANTGLGGASLGGLVTMHLGLTRPDVFGRLLVASPSVWWDGKWILGAVERAAPDPGQRIWIDMGLEEGDSMVPDARALYQALLDRGWAPDRVTHVEAEGAAHETAAWAARTPDMLRFLFPLGSSQPE
ncbi:MAG: alpha/beta hydrolase-fold protein [Bacteroidota bacterium]